MGWFDELIRNLAEAANPRRNIEAYLGMGEPEYIEINGQLVPVNNQSVQPGGLRGAGRVVPAAKGTARSVPGAARPRGSTAQTWRTRGTPTTKTPDRVPTPQPRPRAGGRPTGSPRDVPAARGRSRSGGPQEGIGRPAPGRATSTNKTTQLADKGMDPRTKAAIAMLAGAAGAGGLRNAMSSSGGRQEGTGSQGQVVDTPASPSNVTYRSGHRTPQDAFAGPGSSYGLDPGAARVPAGTAESALDDPGSDLTDLTNEQFDRYAEMIDNISGTYANLAESNMGQIADIFGEVSGVAQGGMAPLADTYAQGQENVGGIYDDLDSRLGGIAGEMQGIANDAAGSAAGDVATTSGAAIAPFEAASATARANAQANMAQHSNAGQNYLSNLASASGEEGKMHASRVQAAAQQRQAEFDIRRMELEMAREEALREIAMDTAGQAAEREAMAALFGAAGVPIPEGMDMDGAQAYLNIGQDLGLFPSGSAAEPDESDVLRSQLSDTGQGVLDTVIRKAEDAWTPNTTNEFGESVPGDRLQDFMFDALAALDDEMALRRQDKSQAPFVTPEWDMEREEDILREIIRNEYSRF